MKVRSPSEMMSSDTAPGYYEQSSLREVGLTVNLGHRGERCPAAVDTKTITVIDITGAHIVEAYWCVCPKAEEAPLQLLSLGLYPASVSEPRTAFTFRVLDDFLTANKVSGTAAQSYFECIRRLTNAAFPRTVPVGPP